MSVQVLFYWNVNSFFKVYILKFPQSYFKIRYLTFTEWNIFENKAQVKCLNRCRPGHYMTKTLQSMYFKPVESPSNSRVSDKLRTHAYTLNHKNSNFIFTQFRDVAMIFLTLPSSWLCQCLKYSKIWLPICLTNTNLVTKSFSLFAI